jgi:hypothetical protein
MWLIESNLNFIIILISFMLYCMVSIIPIQMVLIYSIHIFVKII